MAKSLLELAKSNSGLVEQRPIKPTSPLEAGILTGNPNKAKMAGTRAQLQGASRDLSKQQSLADALRYQQPAQATEDTQQQAEKAETLEGLLSTLGQKISSTIKESISSDIGQQQLTIKDTAPADIQPLLNNFLTYAQNPATAEYAAQAIIDINKALGKTGPEEMLDANEIIDYFNLDADFAEISQNLGETRITGASLGDDFIQELSIELGLGPEVDLANMSVDDIQSLIDVELEQEYGRVDTLRRRLDDPSLGRNERAAITRELQSLQQTGVVDVEQDINDLQERVRQADTINILGEELDIKEILDSEYFSEKIQNYLTDDETKRIIDEEWPELAQLIQEHQTAFNSLVGNLEETAETETQRIRQQTSDIQDTEFGQMDPEDLDLLWPGWDSFSPSISDKPAILSMTNDPNLSLNRRAGLVSIIKQLPPTGLQALKDMSREEILNSNLLDPRNHQDIVKAAELAEQADSPDFGDANYRAGLLGFQNAGELDNTINDIKKIERSGVKGATELDDLLSVMSGDVGEQPARDLLLRNLRQAVRGGSETNIVNAAGDVNKYLDTDNNRLFNLTESAFDNDDRISGAEVNDIISDLDTDDLEFLYLSPEFNDKTDDPVFKQRIVERVRQKVVPELDQVVADSFQDNIKYDGIKDLTESLDRGTVYNQPIESGALNVINQIDNRILEASQVEPPNYATLTALTMYLEPLQDALQKYQALKNRPKTRANVTEEKRKSFREGGDGAEGKTLGSGEGPSLADIKDFIDRATGSGDYTDYSIGGMGKG